MVELLQIAHVAVFALAAVSCLAATWWVRRLASAEVRAGLYGLCVTSALWAVGQLVLFVDPSPSMARASYYATLVAGLATVWAWLYFCSAYAGQEYHRIRRYRRGALGVFLSIVALKLTNPIHGQYFRIERRQSPFPHVRPELFELHAAVEVLAYSSVAIGLFMLFRLFRRSEISTRGLAALVSLTLAPVLLNLLSELGVSALIANSYEPLGVAAFALGALVLADEQFERVRWSAETQLLDQINEGVLVVDESGLVRDYNASARELFPSVRAGRPLSSVSASLAADGGVAAGESDSRILPIDRDGETVYYLLNRTPLQIGPDLGASALVVSDITTVERQRRELKRQSEQLEGFSAAVAHELRNTLTIANSNVTLLADELEADDEEAREKLGRIRSANERMVDIVDDLSTLARLSQTTTLMEGLRISAAVEAVQIPASVTVTVERDGQLRADDARTEELLRNAVELAATLDGEAVTVRADGETVTLSIAGVDAAAFDEEAFFAYGEAVPHAEAGMYGPNIEALARSQGWTVNLTHTDEGFEISLDGVEPAA